MDIDFIVDINAEQQFRIGVAVDGNRVADARTQHAIRLVLELNRDFQLGAVDVQFSPSQANPRLAKAAQHDARIDNIVGADVAEFERQAAVAVCPQAGWNDEVGRKIFRLAFHHREAVMQIGGTRAVVYGTQRVETQFGAR